MNAVRIGELFAGYGGLGMGVQAALGGDIAWVSEIDPGACKILAHRFPGAPNHGDVIGIEWSSVEPVDVLTLGFPCQDVSSAGKRAGIKPGTRSGLWSHAAYAIDQLRPRLVVIENVRGLLSADAHHPAHGDLEPCPWCMGEDGPDRPLRALGAVLGDLADIGYDASWQLLRASDVGAPHARARVFVLAWPAADAERGGRDGGSGAPGQGRWVEPSDGSGRVAADARRLRGERRGGHGELAGPPRSGEGDRGERERHGDAAHDRGATPPDATGARRHESENPRADRSDASPRLRRLQPQRSGHRVPAGDAGVHPWPGCGAACEAWERFAPVIHRWECLTERAASAPVERGPNGNYRLSPRAVEFMMGLPLGWVTGVPGLSRNEQLKALGNGVVPQQASEALRLLLPDVRAVAA